MNKIKVIRKLLQDGATTEIPLSQILHVETTFFMNNKYLVVWYYTIVEENKTDEPLKKEIRYKGVEK